MHYMKISNQGLKAASDAGQLGNDDAMMEAQAAVEIQQAIEQAIPPEFLQIVAKAYEQAQQFQPPQPQDPTQAAAAVQRETIQQRAQSDQMRIQAQQQRDQTQAQSQAQRDQVQAQSQAQRDQVQAQSQAQRDAVQAELQQRQAQLTMQTEMLKQDREDARKQAELSTRLQMNQEDNATAKDLAAAEILSGNKVDVSTGTGINPNP
jgi:hypothetical protein